MSDITAAFDADADGMPNRFDADSDNDEILDSECDGLEPEPQDCPLCGGPAGSMGTLGRREHFRCRDCGKEEIWKAADQKWFYEEAKAHMDATAVRCHVCRRTGRSRRARGSTGSRRGTAPR